MDKLPRIASEITEAHLLSLIANEVAEGKTIEYKRALPGGTRDERGEFLKDVSSFANASGGHLVFGMEETEGKPTALLGLPEINADAEINRLENMLLDSIQPRIPGVTMVAVPTNVGNPAIVVVVPRSWMLPHVVDMGYWRFFSRYSAGVRQLDMSEVRAAFALSESYGERLRQFRAERLGQIVAGETPIPMGEGAKTVLHLVPINAFDPAVRYDVSALQNCDFDLSPLNLRMQARRLNFDGYLTIAPFQDQAAYLQIFRSGVVETADNSLLSNTREGRFYVPEVKFEQEIIMTVANILRVQQHLGVTLPLALMLTMLGVKGYILAPARGGFGLYNAHPIDRSDLLVSEILIEEYPTDQHEVARLLRPVFDAIWNAAGWAASLNYNAEGRWSPR